MADTGNAEGPAAPPTKSSSSSSSTPQKSDHVEQQDFANPTINVIQSTSPRTSASGVSSTSREGTPPPLPPRPRNKSFLDSRPSTSHSTTPTRPQLVSKATTQLTLSDTQTYSDQSKGESPGSSTSHARNFIGLNRSRKDSDVEDSASVRSFAPTIDAGLDAASILGDAAGDHETSLLLALGHRFGSKDPASLFAPDSDFEDAFEGEFDEIEDMEANGSNEESVMIHWRAKLKHFLVLSSAGKPIYSRHGDDQLISNYIGVVQTIIAFYQSTNDTLRGFTAGDVRFVVMSKGPLNLVAITRLPESDAQLRSQLDALYMQILSTLTLPSMERMFAARANYDLRRPLQGTETLLSALADGFTRGSPSTLLSALECLKLRKTQRQVINSTLLKTRSENLLYGLIVASGKLVSVVRPKKHSLHPGDLHLIFNMLFEAGSVKAGGGENWIPLCLPGFNNTGYLYMYVSFLDLERPTEPIQERPKSREGDGDEVAILLISANKEGFFELRGMRDNLVEQLQRNGSIDLIRAAVRAGRPKCTDVVPGSPIRHFLYKSRGNVQFTMPSWDPGFTAGIERRRLLDLYGKLHARLHNKPTSLKILHETSTTNISLAWLTPLFELYCVAPATTSRTALAQAANKVIQWVRREEERVFIIGGAVF
ncbi:trafficking protein Mon1-domain-containing protein [Massariosphaeria phaeospora]|uniref:Vacuolar fusion protein MON1 n=1 Tax=Massariosphaeria phaeospora TaxID=100035 RepID=A0A7C8I2E8_9PLEO|nr:trafficking protein Mon1-domain-containing protein [Massariosphaeria phaeospora]